jgi:glutaredoxin-related protein
MFTLNNFIVDVNSVPADWIFENYLDIPDKLMGQRIRMKSLFNLKDNDPSMYIYYDSREGVYKYKCFSTGKQGRAVNLMMHIWNLGFKDAAEKILTDYGLYLKSGKTLEKKEFIDTKWIISDFEVRNWVKADANYWLQFNIGSELLQKYNVKPLSSYTMSKSINGVSTEEEFTVSHGSIYAYMDSNNQPYKIYQPLKSNKKFLKILDHTQGFDQLEGKKYLIITSSLKDCMSIKSIPSLDVDVIAPHSENSKLSPEFIKTLKDQYDAVVTYMDSDKAGIDSMNHYLKNYNIPFCYIPIEKDFSDIVKHHGISKAVYSFIPVLDKAIAKYVELNKNSIDL